MPSSGKKDDQPAKPAKKAVKRAAAAPAKAPAGKKARASRAASEPVVEAPKKVEPVWDPHQPLPAHLTTAQILAATPPTKPRRTRKRETSKSLGVYDADKDILDQYLYEVSMTPLLTPQQEIAIAKRVRGGDPETHVIALGQRSQQLGRTAERHFCVGRVGTKQRQQTLISRNHLLNRRVRSSQS